MLDRLTPRRLSERSLRDAVVALVMFPGWDRELLRPALRVMGLTLLAACERGQGPKGSEGAALAVKRALEAGCEEG